MDPLVEVLPSKGICMLCNHNIYDDKDIPSWMACKCETPVIKVVEIPKVIDNSWED